MIKFPRCILICCSCYGITLGMAQTAFPDPPNTEKSGRPRTPSETVAGMTMPHGFKVNVWAAEPMVRQPIHICTDRRGRLWVVENFTYDGANNGWYNMKLRDRINVIEDSDGDGVADKSTIFWDGAQRLTSVETGYGGVWALCPPQLLFIPDNDGDDKPDGPPQVVLDGFATKDIGHTIANGLQWGPDGWLYGMHGIQETSLLGALGMEEKDRVAINTGIWRVHPVTKKVEAVCHGGTNPWGMDFTARGAAIFVNTVIGHLFEALPGAHYERMYGSHLNRSVYEYMPMLADHYHWDHDGGKWNEVGRIGNSKTDDMGGGHAHLGCLIYQGDNWPLDYRGKLFTVNLHGRRVNMETLERDGVTHVAHHAPDFIKVDDPWFRGMELRTLPDGTVLMSDWYDTGECHDHDGLHRSTGRIYRISYHGEKGEMTPERVPPFDVSKADMSTLWTWHERTNNWWARAVRHELHQRAVAAVLPDAAALEKWLPPNRTGGAWQTLLSLSEIRSEFKVFAPKRIPVPERPSLLDAALAVSESSASGRYPYGENPPSLGNASVRSRRLAAQLMWVRHNPKGRGWTPIDNEPGKDKVEAIADVDALFRWSARAQGLEVMSAWLALDTAFASTSPALLEGVYDALRSSKQVTAPATWPSLKARLEKLTDPVVLRILPKLAVVFGDGQAIAELQRMMKDTAEDPRTRQQALLTLAERNVVGLADELEDLLDDRVLAPSAVRALAICNAPHAGPWLIARLTKFDPPTRRDAVTILTSRAPWAELLLDKIAADELPHNTLSSYDIRQLHALNDSALIARILASWGRITETPEARRQEIASWKSKLTVDFLSKGDAVAGQLLFTSLCSTCHRLKGAGITVGPDLTGGGRTNLDYLLENIIAPNTVVPKDFTASAVSLKDGRTLVGIVQRADEQNIKLIMQGVPIAFANTDIAEIKTLDQSIMPEGIANALKPEEFRDLIHFLMIP